METKVEPKVSKICVSVDRVKLDKALAGLKLRIVTMGSVTVDEEVLVQALLKHAKVAGNECRRVAKLVMTQLIKEGKQYGEGVEKSGEVGSEAVKGDSPSKD